ncbi:phage tail protein [Aquimarina algicola]|uniref:Phage tail protein n=1 Tax=Aquimarina algicola TaxID=2589995 RepID=A0A504J831_9FLAO|nr:phage tail protein [Aquimarina algicola]TPN86997.1 phage tail protein [Aquimarina algicola]
MEALNTLRNIVDPNPALSHRFGVFFFAGGLAPNRIDFRFQKVSGLSTEIQLQTINEGGQNLHAHRLPSQVNYNNLVLERGYSTSPIPSPLNMEFNIAFSRFQFYPSNVLVTLFDELSGVPVPIGAWLFIKAYPVKWSVSELDAQSNSVLVDTLELAYARFQIMRI